MLAFDLEGGMTDVLETMPGWGTDFVHWPVKTWADFNKGFDEAQSGKYKSVGLDSLSETHIFALMNILDTIGKTRDNPDLIQQGDYGIGLTQLRRLVRHLRDLPMHTFFTAHHKEEVDRKEGQIVTVNLAGKAAIEIPGLMSCVGYLALSEDEDGKNQRVLLLKNYAKFRIGVRAAWGTEVPDEIVDPTVTSLLDALHYSS